MENWIYALWTSDLNGSESLMENESPKPLMGEYLKIKNGRGAAQKIAIFCVYGSREQDSFQPAMVFEPVGDLGGISPKYLAQLANSCLAQAGDLNLFFKELLDALREERFCRMTWESQVHELITRLDRHK